MTKKPDGVSREVFALTAGMPCVVPTGASQYKERKQNSKAVAWRWRDFGNSARSDSFRFHHWAKKNEADEYYFATFNKLLKLTQYTDQEYTAYFETDKWTKAETDELFDLAKRFDTRFIQMADRLSTARSVEEVKARYYQVVRKLMEARGIMSDDELAGDPIYRFQYDKDYETRRKEQLNNLLRRSPADEAEEAQLVRELQAIDGTVKKEHKVRMRAKKQAEDPVAATGPRNKKVKTENRTVTEGRPPRGGGRAASNRYSSKTTRIHKDKNESLEDTIDAKVQRKLQALGVDSWPMPIPAVTIAHGELIDDITRLCELEHKIRQLDQGSGYRLS